MKLFTAPQQQGIKKGVYLGSLLSYFCYYLFLIYRSLSDPVLADDIKWFFRGIGNFADTVERMLPNVKADAKNK